VTYVRSSAAYINFLTPFRAAYNRVNTVCILQKEVEKNSFSDPDVRGKEI